MTSEVLVDTPTLLLDRPVAFGPTPAYAELRAVAPAMRVLTPAGEPAWAVVDAATARQVLSDERFLMTPPGSPDTGSLHSDGPSHARLRRLVARAFTPRAVEGLRPWVAQHAADLVEDLERRGPGSDFVATVARPLPLGVTEHMLGIRVADRRKFHHWTDAVSGLTAGATGSDAERAWEEFAGFLGGVIAEKRAEPGEDLLCHLIAVRDTDDGRLDDRELLTTVLALVAGGYLTVANALSIGIVKIVAAGGLAGLDEPGAAARAAEEVVRLQIGLSGEAFPRWAREEVQLAGVTIAAGEQVLVRLEAANHDPARFVDPERFDRDRDPNPHVGFGHGPHHCIGASLARIELAAALAALARRLSGLALACPPEEVPWTGNPLDDGPASLPVTW
ncbi:cytochrome P450 [Pseudonocardia sp. MH-G8]|uniref:cytochrome P450 n=1 Tax=Pseudonocardia sp. MH-G8 TaxID=1854588 RepID=UPI000BDADDD0|nr:cytochrome P450 [Pseudonocardia sp. MH-G8]OZM82876.1 cytochrome P450 [Pseudonocardia sp. MH-G8]